MANAAMHFNFAAICYGTHAVNANMGPLKNVTYAHLDSCASSHILDPDVCMLQGKSTIFNIKPLDAPEQIKVGGGYVQATHRGTTRVKVRQANGELGVIY